ncbi:hypothetical protein Acr_17g0001660 [Actinidia rufa]|uniref:Uncharacterized protein n=1 Tax=Actinidia rufa TaxID=165716 RepID=A0A7J0G1C9_9ERIC|nr:hypothetical protein Acr_17g0001660 [Actinidia rufa]
MEVLSIQQHARDTLKHHTRARLKGGLGGTGELGMGCRWARLRRGWMVVAQAGAAQRVWLVAAQAGAAQRLFGGWGWWLFGGWWGLQGCTEAAQEAGLEVVWLRRAAQGVGGCLVAAQGDCPRLRRRLKVVAVGFRVWAAVEAD